MPSYVAIFDFVSYFKKGDEAQESPVTVARGEEIKDAAEGQLERLLDPEVHPPYGAVAKKGSPLAVELSKPIRSDEDPRLQRARFDALAGSKAEAPPEPGPEPEKFSPQK